MQSQPNEIFLVLISKYSNSCKLIMDRLQFIEPHFNTRIVDIDNLEDRKMVMNATKNQIQVVPTVFLIYPQTGKMDKYEGPAVVELLDKGVQMVQQKLQAAQAAQQRPRATMVEDLVPEEDDGGDSPHSNIEDVVEDEEYIEDIPRRQDPVQQEEDPEYIDYGAPIGQKMSRKKVGKTGILPSRQYRDDEMPVREEFSEPENERDRLMIERNRNHPPRMAPQRSPSKVEVKPKGSSKKVLVEDLTSLDEELGEEEQQYDDSTDLQEEHYGQERPQGMDMNEILDPSQGQRSPEQMRRSKEHQDRVAAMMAERDSILSREDVRPRISASAVTAGSAGRSSRGRDPYMDRGDPYMDIGESNNRGGAQPQMSNAPIRL